MSFTESSATLVMARDRYKLSRLKQGKFKDEQAYQQLLDKSQQAVQARVERLPDIKLNEDLPVSQNAERLIKAIQDHQVIIVAGETGSGKTTQLPKIALLAGRGLTGIVGHTQPRRLAARSVSQRIAEELGEPLGKSVGFKVRFNETGDANAFIRLMTDGILLAELGNDRFLTKYDTIIIDEAHERSLNIDFLLGYIRQILPKRPDLKVIVTSATLDVNRFSQYFNNAPVFEVEGRSYPVEVRYRPVSELSVAGSEDDAFDDVEENLPRAVVAAVEECYQDAIAKGHPEHADILIFASTEQEIRDLQEILYRFGPKHTEILPLYARLALSEQQKIFNPSGKGRRIIIATNVAETALTVPNIRYVIDSGFARISRYSYRSRVQRLPIEAISQAAANQRKGRCGRIAPGVCIRLYSEEDFLGRPEFTEPEIKRTNLASVILQMASLALGELDNFDFIEPPDHRLVNDGKKLLIELGALSEQANDKTPGSKLTKIGQMMAKMPIDPRLSRMILGGAHFGVLNEVLIVVSALAVQDPRERPADKQTQADQKHALFKEPDSDFLFYIKLWNTIAGQKGQLSEGQRRQFARQHFLSWLRLREWRQTHQQLVELAEQLKLSFDRPVGKDQSASCEAVDYENLHKALLTGLLSFIAQRTDEKNIYQAVRQQKARIFPASTLHKQAAPWLMAFEMVETSQVYLRTLAKIEPEWILLAARNLLKYHYFEPHWSKKSGSVNAYAQISLFGLIIQPRQPLQYETVNLAEAHEIFLRDALVTGELGIAPPFLKHNLQKIEEIERIEDKLRRRDLLVDEETLYQFYAGRIPPHIASRRTFEDWRAEAESRNPRILFLTEEDVLLDHALQGRAATTQQFPDHWQVGALRLATRYVFDPSREDDGATVTVPVQALSQVDGKALSWSVPGWRQPLVEALLKSLPKDKRRLFVPIPDTARKLLSQLDPQQGNSLMEQLAFLLRGEQIQAKDFDLNAVPNYLRPMIQVVDDKKRLIAQARDLDALQARYRVATHQPVRQHPGQLLAFPAGFEFETQQKVAGLLVSQYHALVPIEGEVKQAEARKSAEQQGVVVHTYNDAAEARRHHRQGLLRLASLQLGDLSRQLKKQLPKSLILAFAPLGDKAQLENMLVYAALDVSFEGLAFDQATFEQKLAAGKAVFLANGQQLLSDLNEIFTLWQSIRRQMLGIDADIFGRNLDDIEDQLDGLQLASFVYQVDIKAWQEYPRYLKALNIRLERLPNNLKRDTEAIALIDPFMERLLKYDAHKAMESSQFQEFRWLLEEWRVSLFAQPMKTKVPVSLKRLEKAWQAVQA